MAALSLLDLFRTLASFSPPRTRLADAPWETYIPWAIGNGLAPLASYNLEYVLPGSGAPQWARGQLASIYQGSSNDNVLKLIMFKRLVGQLEGRKLILSGAAVLAESLYPHIAFRPVIELEVLLRRMDVDPFTGFVTRSEFKVDDRGYEDAGATRVLSDGSTPILLFAEPLGPSSAEATRGLFERAEPARLYGPSIYRPTPEDLLMLSVLSLARAGFERPAIVWVDLRELVLGAPTLQGEDARPVDPARVLALATEWRLERALWAALTIVASFFPETGARVKELLPELRGATRQLLGRAVVDPVVGFSGSLTGRRGANHLRRLLTAGR